MNQTHDPHHHHHQHHHGHGQLTVSRVTTPAETGPSGRSASVEGVLYTCPMHPEVRQVGPGNCPICGMALEPLAPTLEEAENPELRDMTRRFRVALVLSLPLLVLTMGRLVGLDVASAVDGLAARAGLPRFAGVTWAQELEAVLATPVVLWAGWPFLARGWHSFRTWNLNMFSLIGLGVAVGYVLRL